MSSAQEFLDVAAGEIGTHEEPPGSNITKYGREQNLTPAEWCMQFVYWCWRKVNLPEFPSQKEQACVGFFLSYARGQGWGVDDPQPGDIACFEWESDTWPDHVEIVEIVWADSIGTIGGNTNWQPGIGDNVARLTRSKSLVLGYVRPPFASTSQPQPAPAQPPEDPRKIEPYPWLPNGVLLSMWCPYHDQVAIYQKQMQKRGWQIDVDGIFGPQTESVTRQFQGEKGLGVDGIVGPITWKAAFELPVTP